MIVNNALIRFALRELPSLEYLCFRGDLDTDSHNLLDQNGFKRNDDLSFQITLKGSRKFILCFMMSNSPLGEISTAVTYQKVEPRDDSRRISISFSQPAPKDLILGEFLV